MLDTSEYFSSEHISSSNTRFRTPRLPTDPTSLMHQQGLGGVETSNAHVPTRTVPSFDDYQTFRHLPAIDGTQYEDPSAPQLIPAVYSMNESGINLSSNSDDDDDDDDCLIQSTLSARCREKDNTDAPKKGKRGVNIGGKTRTCVALSGKITLEKAAGFDKPANPDANSHLTNEIGRFVRTKVSMTTGTYDAGDRDQLVALFAHLSNNFIINEGEDWLWEYINKVARERFTDWKYTLKRFWTKYPRFIPDEFSDRVEEWKCLIRHFARDPTYQARCARGVKARHSDNRVNHKAGRKAICYRAAKYLQNGSRIPWIDAFDEVYREEPSGMGAARAGLMRQKALEILDNELSDEDGVISDQRQIEIISESVGPRKGTRISGIGDCMRSIPLPRGGARASSAASAEISQLKDQLAKKDEEMATLRSEFDQFKEAMEKFMADMAAANCRASTSAVENSEK